MPVITYWLHGKTSWETQRQWLSIWMHWRFLFFLLVIYESTVALYYLRERESGTNGKNSGAETVGDNTKDEQRRAKKEVMVIYGRRAVQISIRSAITNRWSLAMTLGWSLGWAWAVITPADGCCQQCKTNRSRWHPNTAVNSHPLWVPAYPTPLFLSVFLIDDLSCVWFSLCVCLLFVCLRLRLSPFKCTLSKSYPSPGMGSGPPLPPLSSFLSEVLILKIAIFFFLFPFLTVHDTRGQVPSTSTSLLQHCYNYQLPQQLLTSIYAHSLPVQVR